MTRQLTSKSSLDVLKKEAKRWLKALRAGDAAAQQRLERAYPGAAHQVELREQTPADKARTRGFVELADLLARERAPND